MDWLSTIYEDLFFFSRSGETDFCSVQVLTRWFRIFDCLIFGFFFIGVQFRIRILYICISCCSTYNRYVFFSSQMYIMKKKKKKKIFSPFPLCSHQRPSSYSQKEQVLPIPKYYQAQQETQDIYPKKHFRDNSHVRYLPKLRTFHTS